MNPGDRFHIDCLRRWPGVDTRGCFDSIYSTCQLEIVAVADGRITMNIIDPEIGDLISLAYDWQQRDFYILGIARRLKRDDEYAILDAARHFADVAAFLQRHKIAAKN